jgi:hypothetical protein
MLENQNFRLQASPELGPNVVSLNLLVLKFVQELTGFFKLPIVIVFKKRNELKFFIF